jgi:PAS domain S-box-containing protein
MRKGGFKGGLRPPLRTQPRMQDQHKTKTQLIAELEAMRARVAELEHAQAAHAPDFDLAAVAVEWKHAEEALQASERRYRGLADAIPLMVWTTTPTGSLDYFNQRCIDYLGVTAGQMNGAGWQTAIHPDDLPRAAECWLTALRSGEAYSLEYRIRRCDGVYRWHLAHVLPVRSEAGQITFWAGTANDIDDQKRDQEALRQSEARYRLVSRATNDVIWDWDMRAQTLEWNECAQTLFGFSEDQLGSYPLWWDEHIHPEDRERASAGVLTLIERGGQFWSDEYRFRRADQTYAHILDRAYIIRTDTGEPVRMIGAMQDITERKRAEEEIRRLNEELEQRVGERTAQLAVVNKELEAFSYSVSHDLRAPLRHIDGFARLLIQREDQRLDETSARYLHVIGEAARKMGQLIDDLLAFSRMSRTEMQTLPVNLEQVVADVQHELAPTIEGRTISWTIGRLPVVSGDPAMIRLVFVNLLSNAIKYTTPRSEAQISVGATSDADGELVITVSDNGVGFDMRYVHKLFGVFQRLHRDEEFEGTGIGLATVRRIINRHGGRVWAESVPDHGAAFHLTLKRHRSDDADEEDLTGGR